MPDYSIANESFRLLIPRASSSQESWGLLVWISASDEPIIPSDWEAELQKHRGGAARPLRFQAPAPMLAVGFIANPVLIRRDDAAKYLQGRPAEAGAELFRSGQSGSGNLLARDPTLSAVPT